MPLLNLYKNYDDKRKVKKDISNAVKTNVSFSYKDVTEFVHPEIFLHFDGSWNMKDVNYVYLSDKNRYYFVEKCELCTGRQAHYILSEDVRMSFADSIKNLNCTVDRNENLKNGYLHDENYSVYAYEQIVCKMFPNAINQDSIILMTVG